MIPRISLIAGIVILSTAAIAGLAYQEDAAASRRRPRGFSLARVMRGSIAELPSWAHAAAATGPLCDAQSPGRKPTVPAAYVAGGRMACYPSYVAWMSSVSRTPIFSLEHLTRERITLAKAVTREESFHDEPTLPPPLGPGLEDYAGSHYDRGHLSPAGDAPTLEDLFDTFSLGANVVPQDHANNAGIWEWIEGATRYMALKDGEVFAVTGPLFEGSDLRALADRVLVPSSLFKAVYVPNRAAMGVYVSPNDPSGRYEIMSARDFTARTGIDPFPSVTGPIKYETPAITPPRTRTKAWP